MTDVIRTREQEADPDIAARYNYADFVPGKFDQFMHYDKSPVLGEPGPDAPLWKLEDRSETTLSAVWSSHALTVVEFGSFT